MKLFKNNRKQDITLDEREKQVRRNEYIATSMLIIGLLTVCTGASFMDKIYKTYKLMSESTVYQGLNNRDNETDNLDDVQKIMKEIDNIYSTSYINEIERDSIDENVCNALVKAYGDRYAVYMNPKDTVANNNSIGSHIEGIGVLARAEVQDNIDDYDIYIIDVYDNSPAEKAGLKIGDRVIKINDKELSKSKYMFSEALNDIKGQAGTSVKLTCLDKNDNIKEINIVRKNTVVNTVRYKKLTDDVGYIIIRQFESYTDNQFIDAIKDLNKQGVNKFIFDLRDNNGGLKDSVVNMLDHLLPSGVIIQELDKNNNIISTSMSDKNCIQFESVTIINNSTASAAELFTQTLRDYNKTTVIGSTSFGKGTVCTTFNLSNGGSVRVSTSKYITSSGKDLEKVGIDPDIEIKLDEEKESTRYKLDLQEDDVVNYAISLLSGK